MEHTSIKIFPPCSLSKIISACGRNRWHFFKTIVQITIITYWFVLVIIFLIFHKYIQFLNYKHLLCITAPSGFQTRNSTFKEYSYYTFLTSYCCLFQKLNNIFMGWCKVKEKNTCLKLFCSWEGTGVYIYIYIYI